MKQVSKASWQYRLLAEFASLKFLTELSRGRVSICRYYMEVVYHTTMLVLSATSLVSLGVAFGAFVVADIIAIHGIYVAATYGLLVSLTTAAVYRLFGFIRTSKSLPKRHRLQSELEATLVEEVIDAQCKSCGFNGQGKKRYIEVVS